MSRPKKYLVRCVVEIAVEDAAGRELVDQVSFPAGWQFFGTRDAARENILGKIERGFRDLEHELDRVVQKGLASPVESLRRRRGKR